MAVAAARRAFDSGRWARLPPRERKSIMLHLADLLRAHADEFALLETLDTGRPISNSVDADVPNSVYCIQWYAEACDKVFGQTAPLPDNYHGTVVREPVGVVAVIVPWNFPLLLAAWKLAPALAAGNSVILKPSEKSPLTAIRLGELARQAGLPDGVLNVLPGPGNVGRLLGLHHGIDCVSFTGSTATGKSVSRYASESNLKRVWLELGGKSPNIILSDCPDIAAAASRAADVVFYNSGQMCTAGSRILVQRSQYSAFRDFLVRAAERYQPGDPLDPFTTMGAIIDGAQYERVLDYIRIGSREALLLKGGKPRSRAHGYFIEPTVFEATPECTIAREEIFGPVATVIPFDDDEDAIAIANDTNFGLAAGIWTKDVGRAHRIAQRLRAGTVWINCYEEGDDMTMPCGGYRQSGNGRDKSFHALEKFTELKSTVLKLFDE